jgi:thymidine kinase
MAKLYFSYAAMNAGKSTLLLQAAYNYRERGMEVLLLTSALYRDAADGQISSRIGIAAEATLYTAATDLFALIRDAKEGSRLDAIFVDEAQFLTKDQVWQLARVADHLGLPVLAYGLRTDFRGELFEGSAALLAIADSVREVRTICECGRKATMVVRLGPDGRALTEGEQISIEKTTYLSLCRRHWEERMGRFPPG